MDLNQVHGIDDVHQRFDRLGEFGPFQPWLDSSELVDDGLAVGVHGY